MIGVCDMCIRKNLLCNPEQLHTLCVECHEKSEKTVKLKEAM